METKREASGEDEKRRWRRNKMESEEKAGKEAGPDGGKEIAEREIKLCFAEISFEPRPIEVVNCTDNVRFDDCAKSLRNVQRSRWYISFFFISSVLLPAVTRMLLKSNITSLYEV